MKTAANIVVVFSSIAMLGGCSNANVEAAKKKIESQLADPLSAQYRNITTSSQGVVCGEVNAKNKMGGYTGFQQFVYNGLFVGEVHMSAISDQKSLWCTTSDDLEKDRQERLSELLRSNEKGCADPEFSKYDMQATFCEEAKKIKAYLNKK
jgi:hypothetical protein